MLLWSFLSTKHSLDSLTRRLLTVDFIMRVAFFYFLGVSSNSVKEAYLDEFSSAPKHLNHMNHTNTQVNADLQSSLYQTTNSFAVDAAIVGYSSSNLKGHILQKGHFLLLVN